MKRHFFKRKRISGITTSDWMTVYNTIKREHNAAEATDAPTAYMNGLTFALNTLDTIRPYNIKEVH